ncbi:MAG: enoyl-CoA hydratase [Candidatus Hydrogenedentes bacterium]|nr:enoyl-CoA hydratase [Candidatus Hydrogenedentota bacterium]
MTTENGAAEHILVSQEDGIMTIEFNRPDKKNALTHTMYNTMIDALEQAEAESTVRALCFRGAGTCFTSGNDLKDFLANPPSDEQSPVMRFLHTLIDLKKPIVAVVQGPAIGIGTTMLLHCDIVLATPNAAFQTPFTKLALCPEAGSSFLLPRVVGMTRALSMLLTSQNIDANTAVQWGLVTELIPSILLDTTVQERLAALAALPPEAVRVAKALIRDPLRDATHDAVEQEAVQFMQRLTSDEAAEAMQAFLEKRTPDFSRFG